VDINVKKTKVMVISNKGEVMCNLENIGTSATVEVP